MNRRALLQAFPALLALSELSVAQDTQPQQPPLRISKEMLRQALQLAGLEFTEAQLDLMLPGVNRNLASYESLRKITVPLDTEPAYAFRPLLPGEKLPSGRPKWQPTRFRPLTKWGKLDELAFLPATELGALVKAKRITPTELTKMYVERLKIYSPKLNCTITLTEDLALEQAAKATAEIQRGHHRGPLHGIPYGAKDLFNTKGIRTTWGAEPYVDHVPEYNATVIERLEKHGSVLIAKLSMGALAQGGLWFGGMTKTPWDYEQTSSGSSAGSASATAAGLVGFSVGTETLGSIVTPSTRCGVTGVRPTYGRISRYGAMALSWTMDKIGPICRSVEDCAEVLRVVAGSDGHDLTATDAPIHWQPRLPLRELKIGYVKEEFDKLEGESKTNYDAALEALRKASAKLEPMRLPDFDVAAIRPILVAEAATAFDDLTRNKGVDALKGQAANDWPNTFRTARTQTAVEYIRAQRIRTLLMREMSKLMTDFDLLVTPPFSPALTITNLTGHPQVVVPCGFLKTLPQSIVFTGRLYEEGTPMRVAHAYQQATEWHKKHPVLRA